MTGSCPHGRPSWASCPHCLGLNRLPAGGHWLCMSCSNTTDGLTGVELACCPSCGDSKHPPADLDDTVTITLTKHELRILTIWAENWARQCGGDALKAMGVILLRLGTQTDVALTLSQEIADLRAAFPDSEVTVHRKGPGPVTSQHVECPAHGTDHEQYAQGCLDCPACMVDAIDAAAEALNDGLPGGLILDEGPAWRAAKRALTAALPALTGAITAQAEAGERERILSGDDNDPDPAGSVYRLGHRHGRADERERIRQRLTDHVAAARNTWDGVACCSAVLLADLLDGRADGAHTPGGAT